MQVLQNPKVALINSMTLSYMERTLIPEHREEILDLYLGNTALSHIILHVRLVVHHGDERRCKAAQVYQVSSRIQPKS